MRKLNIWMGENIGKTVLIIIVVDALFFFALVHLLGCARPPGRFDNGDHTVLGPPTQGEVVEPNMVKPEPD